jgi:hypothetical protein
MPEPSTNEKIRAGILATEAGKKLHEPPPTAAPGMTRAEKQRGEEEIYIDLPSYQDRITLDGVVYMHSRTYSVRPAVAETMREIMGRAWQHDHEIKDHSNANAYRRPKSPTLRGR